MGKCLVASQKPQVQEDADVACSENTKSKAPVVAHQKRQQSSGALRDRPPNSAIGVSSGSLPRPSCIKQEAGSKPSSDEGATEPSAPRQTLSDKSGQKRKAVSSEEEKLQQDSAKTSVDAQIAQCKDQIA